MSDFRVNFFVVGAAKSGTTALHDLLSLHESIDLPLRKETNYFANSERNTHYFGPMDKETITDSSIKSLSDYKKEFSRPHANIRGEVCPLYLFSADAPLEIYRHNPDAKIIIILRDPVARAWSNYCHLVMEGRENSNFSTALHAEEDRRESGWGWFWQIKALGLYSSQVDRYQQIFPAENLLLLKYEDFARNSSGVMHRILSFIGAEDMEISFAKTRPNVSTVPRKGLSWLHTLIHRPGKHRRLIRAAIPQTLRHNSMRTLKSISGKKSTIPEKDRRELLSFYMPDIKQLEFQTGMDFSEWYKGKY